MKRTKDGRYPHIDTVRSGRLLKERILKGGYTIDEMRQELYMESVQALYKWFRGEVLPTVDHYCILSEILHCDIRDLIIMKGEDGKKAKRKRSPESFPFPVQRYRRLVRYYLEVTSFSS